MKAYTKPIYEAVFTLLIFLLPVQLGYHFWPEWSHVFGIRIDYLAPTVYLTDILVFILLVLGFYRGIFKIKIYPIFLLVLAIFVVLNTINASAIYPAIFKWIKVGELVLFAYLVKGEKDLDIKAWILRPLLLSIILFSLIGIGQFFLGHTLGGPFYFLGERSFYKATPGISRVVFFGREYLRPYSTFSHPNSFAGFLGVSLLLTISLFATKTKEEKMLKKVSVILGSAVFFLISSAGAALGILFGAGSFLVYLRGKRIFEKAIYLLFFAIVILSLLSPLIYPLLSPYLKSAPESVLQRISLTESAGRMISERPLLGVGLNNFIVSSPPLLQPVHNIFLLVFSETGIVGLLLFLYLIFKCFQNLLKIGNWKLIISILVVLVTGLADHYWLTLQQNQLLLSLLFGLSLRDKNG